VIASIQPTHAYVLISIYLHSMPILFLRSASVTCGMLKIGLFVSFFFSFRGIVHHIFTRDQSVSKVYMRSGHSLIAVQGSLLVPIFPLNRSIHYLLFMLLSLASLQTVNLRMGLMDGSLSSYLALTFISFRIYIGSQNND
jgi:hypothetical protein